MENTPNENKQSFVEKIKSILFPKGDKKDLEIISLKNQVAYTYLKLVGFGLFFVFEIFIGFVIFKQILQVDKPNHLSFGDKGIAVYNIDKQITNKYIDKIITSMEKIRDDEDIEEVLVIMNSPGGSPSASEEMSEYLKNFAKDKNVTMYIQSIAASGGYYIASAIKPLYSNKNAIVGSIGVILPHYDLSGIAKKIGIKEDDIEMGKYKKPIPSLSAISPEMKKYLINRISYPMYINFLQSVSNNRGVKLDVLKKYANGQIFMANNPKIKGVLIDEITTLTNIKRKLKDKYSNLDIEFIYPLEGKEGGLFGSKVELNLDVNLPTSVKFNNGEIIK
jgi:protease-4